MHYKMGNAISFLMIQILILMHWFKSIHPGALEAERGVLTGFRYMLFGSAWSGGLQDGLPAIQLVSVGMLLAE